MASTRSRLKAIDALSNRLRPRYSASASIMSREMKTWRDHFDIDPGLPDEWLERVNSLIYWEVKSTCEGHPRHLGKLESDHARIAIGIREQYASNSTAPFYGLQRDWDPLLKRHFKPQHTYATLRCEQNAAPFAITIGTQPKSFRDYGSFSIPGIYEQIDGMLSDGPRCILELHHLQVRTTDCIPASVLSWLNEIKDQLVAFDCDSRAILERKSS